MPDCVDGPWLLLVGGEHHDVMDGKSWLGNHCSMKFIGQAYASLVNHFTRARVVVICQLNQTLHWLYKASQTGEPLFTKDMDIEVSKKKWEGRLAAMREDCAQLIADGGPDYDGEYCNTATVLDVLRGRANGPCIPPEKGSCVLVGFYSHGWSHETFAEEQTRKRMEAKIVCDLCQSPHVEEAHPCTSHSSLSTREWYMHLEHEVPVARREELYRSVATTGHEHPFFLLYGSQLVSAYADMFAAAPNRPVVVLNNYCGSDGMLKFMRKDSFRKYTGVNAWPLALMSAAGEMEGAISGGLLPIYCRLLHQYWASGKNETLGDFFRQVESQYLRENPCLARAASIPEGASCLLCTFAGQKKLKGLCSVCFKKWEASAPEEKDRQPDLTILQQQRAAALTIASTSREPSFAHNDSPKAAYCKLGVEYGDSKTSLLSLEQLFFGFRKPEMKL